MNSPDPLPTPVTPIASQWDSAVIRQLAYAGLGLVATVLADVFNLSTAQFTERGGRVIDSILAFAVIAVPIFLAYRARKNTPTPPISGTPGVAATVQREIDIATATTPEDKSDAVKMKLHPLTVVIALMVSVALMSGCSISPTKPLTTAQTIPQKGYAAVGLYQIAQARSLDVMRLSETPSGVKAAIADADARATPIVLQLTQALKLYSTIEQITSGPAGDRLAEAVKRIDELTSQALPLIEALQTALGKGPKPIAALPLIPRGSPALAWSNAR
jgi:hypothetical protein